MRLVISAVNLTEGGPLTILRDAVRAAAEHHPEWDIVVAVHRAGTVTDPRVREVAFPAAKHSWLRRVWLEWVGFNALSKQWGVDVWLSLHDITPRVQAGRQYVYCHNPAPFCTVRVPLERLERKFKLFRRFYGALYGCFIHRNAAVIVQQEWLREAFMSRFGVQRVIVAHPSVAKPTSPRADALLACRLPSRFLYPAFPRCFKNFEVIGDSLAMLETRAEWQGEVIITIDGTENRYAQVIKERYGSLRTLRFVGLQPPLSMNALYQQCDALLFPSLLETWGMPITEAQVRGLPLLVSDLPYARETVGNSESVRFFDPTDPAALADLLFGLSQGTTTFSTARRAAPIPPFAGDWAELMAMILDPIECEPQSSVGPALP